MKIQANSEGQFLEHPQVNDWGKKTVNIALGPAYFVGAHWYDALCYTVSNIFNLVAAAAIIFSFLSLLSVVLIFSHQVIERKFDWDLMGLEEFKGKKETPIPSWRIFKRFKLWLTRNRKTTFWFGSIIIGPPIVTILIRENKNWPCNLKYILSGSFLSTAFWVPIWSGVGWLTWEQYVLPLWRKIS